MNILIISIVINFLQGIAIYFILKHFVFTPERKEKKTIVAALEKTKKDRESGAKKRSKLEKNTNSSRDDVHDIIGGNS